MDLCINDWLPVFVKSEEWGLMQSQARALVLEGHEMLHKAVDKALVDLFKYDWRHKVRNELFGNLTLTKGGVAGERDAAHQEGVAKS